MSGSTRLGRLSTLKKVPLIAALDHRLFLDKDGNDKRLKSLSRKDRRKLEVESRRLSSEYNRIIGRILRSGAGYPIDKLIRSLSIEYTHRYATSGTFNQPLNFNYFEPFCDIKFIDNSVAPYAEPAHEYDHLFSVTDYFDYITSDDAAKFNLSDLIGLPDGKIFHFTIAGSIDDFTFLTAEGREFLVAGFSLVRRGNSLHWYALGGETFSETEWNEKIESARKITDDQLDPLKRLFLSESPARTQNTIGDPIPLEGASRAIRTIICGETDLGSRKHLARCLMTETEHSFQMLSDDPDLYNRILKANDREDAISRMRAKIENAAPMWNLAESLFQLPNYFSFKVKIVKSIAVSGGHQIKRPPKGGTGLGIQFRNISALEYVENDAPALRAYTPPNYQIETSGFWRRLGMDKYGQGPDGTPTLGKTWIKSNNRWRERPDSIKTVYIKSSIATAKLLAKNHLDLSSLSGNNIEQNAPNSSEITEYGILYVLRCAIMKENVYKIGWTSGTAEARAKELSTATGVPISFIVVDYWKHPSADKLEKNVHALLSPYRVNDNREFFEVDYTVIRNTIENEIDRASVYVK